MIAFRNLASRSFRTIVPVLALLLLLPPAAAWAQTPDGVLRVYESRFLSSNTALQLALQVCGDDEQRCRLERLTDAVFTLRASDAVHEEFSALLAERDVPPATQGFRIILLEASQQGSIPDLPDGAGEALEDLARVLPYRGYRQIDTALVRTAHHASTRIGEMGAFTVELSFRGDPGEVAGLELEFVLRHSFGEMRPVMSSSFAIEVGETVVVGTSRPEAGEHALVVLLTPLAER